MEKIMVLSKYSLDFHREKLINPVITVQILPCEVENKNMG